MQIQDKKLVQILLRRCQLRENLGDLRTRGAIILKRIVGSNTVGCEVVKWTKMVEHLVK
jgi:hypothetical protein